MSKTRDAKIRDVKIVLHDLEHGETMAELSAEMTGLVAFLQTLTHNRPKAKAKGTITLALDVTVEGDTVDISPDIKVKRPKKPRNSSTYFVTRDGDGSLSTEHPSQLNMFPREVGGERDSFTSA